MKQKWIIDENNWTIELEPETLADKSLLESIDGSKTAAITKNGRLTFKGAVSKEPIKAPIHIDRSKDDVRDSGKVAE